MRDFINIIEGRGGQPTRPKPTPKSAKKLAKSAYELARTTPPKDSERIIVSYEHQYSRDEETNGDGQYDYSWTEDGDFIITGVRLASTEESLKYNEEGYLVRSGSEYVRIVYGVYSYGDSFGRGSGNGFLIGAFADESKANNAVTIFDSNADQDSIEIEDDFGRKVKIANPGSGYFETLDYVHCSLHKIR